DQGDSLGPLEVHREVALAAVHGHEGRAVAALVDGAQVTRGLPFARRLELDDIRAQVGQVHRAVGRRHRLGEVDDAQAGQGLHAWPRVGFWSRTSQTPR